MPRHQRTTDAEDRITIARLDGSARRLLDDHTPSGEAVAAVHAITRDPRILARAGGTALGAWRTDPKSYRNGRDIAGLMVHAGADEQLLQQVADETAATLPDRRAYGA